MSNKLTAVRSGGQFGWFASLGATPEAIAVLNDQPLIFTVLVIVLVTIILQILVHVWIHKATMKPEQMKKKKDDKKPPAKK